MQEASEVPNLQQRVLQEASPEELMVRSNLLGALTGAGQGASDGLAEVLGRAFRVSVYEVQDSSMLVHIVKP